MFKLLILGMLTLIIILVLFKAYDSQILNIVSRSPGSCATKDIVFSKEFNLKADIYYPPASKQCQQNTLAQTIPTVVFIHGGSWRNGNKETYKFVADFFTNHGYNVIIPSYRLYPEAAYPEFISDLERFFVWLSTQSQAHNIQTDDIFLIGHSAGAYNAAMYLFSPNYKKPMTINGFVGLAGPYDFFLPATQDKEYYPIFTQRDPAFNSKGSQPAQQLPNKDIANVLTKALILHGSNDTTVTPKNPEHIHPLLLASGVKSHYKIYPDKDHVQLVTGLANIPFLGFKMREDILTFMAE